MNRRYIIGLSAITVLGLAMVSSNAMAQQQSLKDQLAGIWTLVSSETTAPNGSKQQPMGANPKGILMLDAGGRYAAMMTRADRPKFKSRNRAEITTEEFAAAAKGTIAQYGTWSVNEADKTLVRRADGALIPNTEGTESKNAVALGGDELKITATAQVTSGGGTNVAVYRRAK
jgi:hypothetical protein